MPASKARSRRSRVKGPGKVSFRGGQDIYFLHNFGGRYARPQPLYSVSLLSADDRDRKAYLFRGARFSNLFHHMYFGYDISSASGAVRDSFVHPYYICGWLKTANANIYRAGRVRGLPSSRVHKHTWERFLRAASAWRPWFEDKNRRLDELRIGLCMACRSVVDRNRLVRFFRHDVVGIDEECYEYLREQCRRPHSPILSMMAARQIDAPWERVRDPAFIDEIIASHRRLRQEYEDLPVSHFLSRPCNGVLPVPDLCALCGGGILLGTRLAVMDGDGRPSVGSMPGPMFSVICEFCRNRILAGDEGGGFEVLGWSYIITLAHPHTAPGSIADVLPRAFSDEFGHLARAIGIDDIAILVDWNDPYARLEDIINPGFFDLEMARACTMHLDIVAPIRGKYRTLAGLRKRIRSFFDDRNRLRKSCFVVLSAKKARSSPFFPWDHESKRYLYGLMPVIRTNYGHMWVPKFV